MTYKSKIFALSAISLALAGCGSDILTNQVGSLTLAGEAREGQTLTATAADPDGINQSTLTFTWFAGGNIIEGETTGSLTLTVDEANLPVFAAATYTDNQGFTETHTTDPTAPVIPLPVNIEGVLTIGGSATVEQTLTAVIDEGNGLTDLNTVVFQWLADGNAIEGETNSTLLLTEVLEGAVISVTATYTDDQGFVEDLTAQIEGVVEPVPQDNQPGTLEGGIAGNLEPGQTLTAPTPVDPNGVGTVVYQWQMRAEGADLSAATDIPGATESTYVVTESEVGQVVSVNVSYTDGGGFDEALTESAVDIVFNFFVTGEASFANALANAAEGAIIGIGPVASAEDDYDSMAELSLDTNGITITLVNGSDAVITGTTCFDFGESSDGITIDGLIFDDIIIPNDGGCGEGRGSIDIDGSNHVITNNQFLGDSWVNRNGLGSSDESHYISVAANDVLIERNLFTGKSVNEGEEGSIISIFIERGDDLNTADGSSERVTVQYNLFRDMIPTIIDGDGELDTDSGSHAVQVGRASSSDGEGVGNHIVQYNRFDTTLYDRGLLIVQGGANTIKGNTVVNSWGNFELRNGFGNTLSDNIFIAAGGNFVNTVDGVEGSANRDGGIAVTPLGHTVSGNYIANIASNSSDRSGILIDSDHLDSGNSSSTNIIASGLDLTTVISGNTVLNTNNAIQFEHNSTRDGIENCTLLDYVLDLDNNLLANQSTENNIFGTETGNGAALVLYDEYPELGCLLGNASDFDNNHFYATEIADIATVFERRDNVSIVDGVDGNILLDGTQDGATLTAPDANLLVEGAGSDAGIGAQLSNLIFLEEDMVGPGSTFVVPE
jgi:poly(beta-D-mannuronate) lyase